MHDTIRDTINLRYRRRLKPQVGNPVHDRWAKPLQITEENTQAAIGKRIAKAGRIRQGA